MADTQSIEVPQVPNESALIAGVDWDATDPNKDGADVPVGETAEADAAPAEGGEDERLTRQREQEELARTRGWVEQEKWHGKAGGWVPAEVYNQRHEQIMPFVTRENRELRKEISTRDQQLADAMARIGALEKAQSEQQQVREQIQVQTLLSAKAQAESEGDFQRANQIGNELLDLKIKGATPAPAQAPQPKFDHVTAGVLQEFADENPTVKDPTVAARLYREVKTLREGGMPADTPDEKRAVLNMAFALMNGTSAPQQRRASPMAEMNGSPRVAPNRARTWADLKPEEARRQEQFIRSTPQYRNFDEKQLAKVRAETLANMPASAFRR